MGSACGKSNSKPTQKMNSFEVELKTKKEFQQSWEKKKNRSQTDVVSIWGLSIAMQDIYKVYHFDKKEIGSGHYGVVRKAALKLYPDQVYAVKSVKKEKLKGDIDLFKNELELLRFSDHPNIIQFYEIYQDNKYFHFVMEMCEGGDITTRLEKNNSPFSEETSKRIIFQILLAVNHLHSCNIVHRDIKLDNFLFKSHDINSEVKLTDFGLSKRVVPGSKLQSLLGTPFYVAPEILEKKGYTEKCDIWSIGVCLYLTLSKSFPFKGVTTSDLFSSIRTGEYSLSEHEGLRKLSHNGRSLLKSLLEKNPQKRFSASEALRHVWFDQLNIENNERGKAVMSRKILSNLRSFQSESKFTKEVIRLLVINHPDHPEVEKLKEVFFYLDILNSGVLTQMEIHKAYTDLGEEISMKEVEEIVKSLELRTRNVVTFTDFITSTIQSTFYTNEISLEEVFKRFDIDQDHYINYEDIQDCFCRFGVELPRKEINQMIADFDENSDGKISKEEFMKMMRKDFHRISGVFGLQSPEKLRSTGSGMFANEEILRRNI